MVASVRVRPGYDMKFKGCEEWNAQRRIVPTDEAFFRRTDFAQVRANLLVRVRVKSQSKSPLTSESSAAAYGEFDCNFPF